MEMEWACWSVSVCVCSVCAGERNKKQNGCVDECLEEGTFPPAHRLSAKEKMPTRFTSFDRYVFPSFLLPSFSPCP